MLTHAYQTYYKAHPDVWPPVFLGQRVVYHSKVSGVQMVALVTCTFSTYNLEVGRDKLKPPTSMNHLHLKVLSPGDTYDELDVPPGYGKGQWAPLEAGLS